jgi:hypothetical protein
VSGLLPEGTPTMRLPGQPTVADALNMEGAQDLSPQPGVKIAGAPAIGGMNPLFLQRFAALQKAVRAHGGDLDMFSGARDDETQAKLFMDAVAKYGTEALAKKFISPPGKSHHHPNAGLQFGVGDGAVGADLRGDLAIAHKLAPHFGVEFGDKNNPWHVALAGLKK